jgi:O-antigen ligase
MTAPHLAADNAQAKHQNSQPPAMPLNSVEPVKPVTALAWMMFLAPALGVPSELILQDTLKSAIVAFGVLIAALLFFWQTRQRSTPLQWHGLVWLPLLLMVYALSSMVWSHTYLAAVEVCRWFVLGLLLWLGINTLSKDNVPKIIGGMHAGTVAASLWVLLQFWADLALFPQAAFPASTFVNRNFFAEYAVCALPFSVWLLLGMRTSRWLGWMALSVAVNVVALMMTGTRSALVALLVLIPVMVVILIRYQRQFACAHWSRTNKAMVAGVLLVGIVGLGSIPSDNAQVIREKIGVTALERSFLRTASMAKAAEYTQGSFSMRSVMWKATARMMMANPLTGVGAGSWEVQIPLYQRVDSVLEADYYAHNEFLQLLSEYGVVAGGLVLALLFAYLLFAAGTTWRLQESDQAEAPLRGSALASLLALILVSNAGFPLHLACTGTLFAMSLAILAGSDARLGNYARFFTASLPWRVSFTRLGIVLLLTCTALAAVITIRAAQAERKIVHALQLAAAAKAEQPISKDWSPAKAQILDDIREGISINSHYRRLTALVAEPFAAAGDWANAVWILESVVASRPHVAALWSGLARGYSEMGQFEQASNALQQVKRLKPDSTHTRALEISLLSRAGRDNDAIQLLKNQYDRGDFDFEMTELGYAIGYKTRNWPLAVRSLELRNVTWPEQAADGHFRLGKVFLEPEFQDRARALLEFRSGLAAVPTEQKGNYLGQVPQSLSSEITKAAQGGF